MTTVLIIGSKGMLGQELVRIYENEANHDVVAWDRDDIDVTDLVVLKNRITDVWPDVIYNAVAYNAVDACETDDTAYHAATVLNSTVPEELARIAAQLGAILVHYSTDYVFDGKRPHHSAGQAPGCCGSGCPGCMYKGPENTLPYFAYHEDDIPRPLSRYGQTKLAGEVSVAKKTNTYYIIRLSKLFGTPASSAMGKRSFFDVMRELGEKNAVVQAVDGEISKFTYAPDLARASKEIVEGNMAYGIYHVANAGAATWYDGVKALYDILGFTTTVEPVPPETFPRPAARPASSVLKVTKIKDLRHYTEALREYLEMQKKA
jgi:dTDP-4-dehydrorhamnose reductase